jgi:endonuclease/exonuclease/phosphatase family metal-dependent hydrolase
MKDQSASRLRVTTYNIHKGFSQFNRRMMVHELRERLRHLDSDIVFLQEVQGLHLHHASNHDNWPEEPQHEFLAEDVWQSTAYGQNVVYDHGHHGNAILSRFPIFDSHNQDVTHLQVRAPRAAALPDHPALRRTRTLRLRPSLAVQPFTHPPDDRAGRLSRKHCA